MLRCSNYAFCSNIALDWSKTVKAVSSNSNNALVEKNLDGYKVPLVQECEKTIHSRVDEEDLE
ncbi:unnamed protein product, partial [Aphanomyces euteiches]